MTIAPRSRKSTPNGCTSFALRAGEPSPPVPPPASMVMVSAAAADAPASRRSGRTNRARGMA
jgi:hypothetical protein